MSVSRKLAKSARTLANNAAQSEILKCHIESSEIVLCVCVGSLKFRTACGRAGKKCHCQFRSETTTTHTPEGGATCVRAARKNIQHKHTRRFRRRNNNNLKPSLTPILQKLSPIINKIILNEINNDRILNLF